MAFRTNAAPYQRAKLSTTKIMLILTISLLVVWISAVITTFIKAGSSYGIKSILMLVVAVVVTEICDVITTLLKHKKGAKTSLKNEILDDLLHNYSYVTAIIFTLTLPVWASYYVVIIGSIFSTVVVKNFFGGFGKNIFNPAIMGRIFVGLCFAMALPSDIKTGIDATTGATITTAIKNSSAWLSDLPLSGFTMTDLFLGNYLGAMGETFTILILVIGIVLSVLKVINWRTPVFYLSTVVITAFVIGLVCGFENPLRYVGYHVALGGLVFGAVFMLTDPVTGPTSSFGKSLIGVIAGLMTVLIRIKGGYPEGVMFSIAICNFISPAIDYLTVGKSNFRLPVKYATVFGSAIISVILCSCVAFSVNGGKEVYAINGISLDEYNTMVEKYGFDLVGNDQLSIKENGKEAYFVVNENKEKVAVVYLVKLDHETSFEIDGYPQSFTMTAYVAIDLTTKNIYDIAFKVGSTGGQFTNVVDGWTDGNIVGKDQDEISSIDIVDGSVGATHSAKAVKEVIEVAYETFATEYGGN